MKRQFKMALVLSLAVLCITSCGLFGGNKSSASQIVHNGVPCDAVKVLSDAYLEHTGNVPSEVGDSSAVKSGEVVLGETSRAVSGKGYLYLSRMDKSSDDFYTYLIYSDGTSYAIAYEEDEFGSDAALYVGIDWFIENCVAKNAFKGKTGVLKQGEVDPIAWQKARDEVVRDSALDAIASQVGGSLGEDIADSAKQYYALITDDIIKWMANLYDPATGGFYYSNSGRNTIGYGTDIESTYQILEFLMETGALDSVGGSPSGLPDEMKERLVSWIKPMQNSNGYFYHPQWSKDAVDRQLSRRGRDLKYAEAILAWCGVSPTYDTPNGTVGDGLYADGSAVAAYSEHSLTERLGASSVTAVSAVLTSSVVPVNSLFLEDAESFKKYLDSLDIRGDAYEVGNELSSQAGQIKHRDAQLVKAGKASIIDVVEKWLLENQNPENGTWYFVDEDDKDYSIYSAINGLLKISSLYNALGIEIKYADVAINTAIKGINSDEIINTACHVYNPWFAVNNIFENLTTFSRDKVATAKKIEGIRTSLRNEAPESIVKTMEKVKTLQKQDGTFSYFPDRTSDTSQGMAVAVPGTNEGDVNSTIICSQRIPEMIFTALGLDTPKAFGSAAWYLFSGTVMDLGDVIKDEFVDSEKLITFDDDDIGSKPSDVAVISSSNGTFVIEDDPRTSKKGNILAFRSVSGGTDNLYAYCDINSVASCYVFESDMCITSESSGYIASISLDECYMIGLRIAGGRVHFLDSSSNSQPRVDIELGSSVALGEWFNLRIEYYYGSHDTVRAKMYINDTLVSVSDNYYDKSGDKLTDIGIPSSAYSYARIIAFKNANINILIDNLIIGKTSKTYKRASDPNKQPVYNVDPPDNNKTSFDFEDGRIPLKFFADNTSTEGVKATYDVVTDTTDENGTKVLKFDSNGSTAAARFTTKLFLEEKNANAYVFETDINYSFGNSNYFYLDLLNGTKTVYTLAFKKTSSGLMIYDMASGSASDSPYGTVNVDSGWFNLRVEYYPEDGDTSSLRFKTYVDGKLVYVSDNYNSANTSYLSKIDSAVFRCYKGKTTVLYLDNTGFVKCTKTNDNDVLGAKNN